MPQPELIPIPEDLRAEDYLWTTPVGTHFDTIHQDQRRTYVFIGWRQNTAGHEMVFVESYRRDQWYGPWSEQEPWVYHATMLHTLIKKFPSLYQYLFIFGGRLVPRGEQVF